MKKVFSLLAKFVVIFLSVFITPAVIASIITLDKQVYMNAVTHPTYDAFFGIASFIFTSIVVSMIVEEEADQKRVN